MKSALRKIWLLGLLLFPHWLSATQFIPLSIEQLAQKSAWVVQGTVQSKTCLRDANGSIYTRIELSVADVWKGSYATNRFIVVQGGGTLGDEKVVVSGQVEYKVGEEVVAFLDLNQRGEGVTHGLAQGKFETWVDPATGEKLTRNLFHGQAATTAGTRQTQSMSSSGNLKLSDLKRQVQAVKQ